MSTILDRVVERTVLDDHDGRSGARLERVRLDDGTPLVVKYADPSTDLTVALTGGIDRERLLWTSGVLDRLPPGLGHAIVEVADQDGTTVTVMRDLGDAVPGWTRTLTTGECDRILTALTDLHRAFLGDAHAGLCPLETRLTLLSPRVAGSRPGELPRLIVRGWECFADLVDPSLAEAVFSLHDNPAPLANALRRNGTTMLHADLWPVNLALLPNETVFLDWALATEGPPALDLAIFLSGSAAHITPTRESLITRFRSLNPHVTATDIDLALLAGLADLAWNKALDATDHKDSQTRTRAAADLHWWTTQARPALNHL
ncbi:phosphotransferase [Kribbella sp. NPDC050124]|uniref:phosphotransferase n=1 Tax=Kribbella sp. NPDC050124 TaxID=3364114 RepID=UPI00378AD821